MRYDYLIVGAGFAGSVLAERLASQAGKRILLIDRRTHIAGNAYDEINADGILIHRSGPHIFHTNDSRVYEYLSAFTAWRQYEYRVLSSVNGMLVPIPVNRTTVNMLCGTEFRSGTEVEEYFARTREGSTHVTNSEEYVVSRIGRRLYELIYAGYTKKQWGIPARELAPSVCGRIPIRTNLDDRYFDDRFQGIPEAGYTELFRRILDHPNIELRLGTEFRQAAEETFNTLIYTGQIDEYFSFVHGRLPYRSLRFAYDTWDREFVQTVATIHYPNEHPYTRTTEYKHLTGQRHAKTTVAKEFPCADGEPYYPIPNRESELLYEKYRAESAKLRSVRFLGRLGSYRYYNMDQVIAQSLIAFEQLQKNQNPV